ncbi:MAG TPA: OmpA family protein [Stellaceae bacterium]|nr:OmpA family protein [Stellaceae bacterium]
MAQSRLHSRTSRRVSGALVLGALTLAGCTDYSATPAMHGNAVTEGMTTAAAKDALRSDNKFSSDLGREYYQLASARAGESDWADADFFGRKSLAASKGETVLPEDNRNWLIAGQGVLKTQAQRTNPTLPNEMLAQRQRLVTALDGGGRDKYPALSARAQMRFDCWIERSEANVSTEHPKGSFGESGQCQREYTSSISDLEVLLHPPGPYNAYFDWNGKNLKSDASQIVKQAAVQIPQDGTARVKVVGWADRSGSDAYNAKLAEKRVEAVRAALVADGMARDRIDVTAKGETDTPVPTKDGVREPKNRVVEIRAVVPSQVASTDSSR